jgi:hypothetical protein
MHFPDLTVATPIAEMTTAPAKLASAEKHMIVLFYMDQIASYKNFL